MTAEYINPKDLPPPPGGIYTHVVKASGTQLHISGQLPRDLNGKLVGPNDITAQFHQVWANIVTALKSVGLGPEHLVRTTTYVVGQENIPAMRKVREGLTLKNPPTSTMVVVAGLAMPGALLEIESLAVFPEKP